MAPSNLIVMWLIWMSVNVCAVPLSLCRTDADDYPWAYGANEGLTIELLQAVGTRLGVEFTIAPLPWKRCLSLVADGHLDAAVAASYSAERAVAVEYPLNGAGQPDAARRLNMDHYSLYCRRDAKLNWNGEVLQGANGGKVIAAPLGYSVVDKLRRLGVRVDESDKDSYRILRKVAAGVVDGGALLATDGDETLVKYPDIARDVMRVSPNLEDKPYYLVFSKAFRANHADTATRIWDAIAVVRDTPEYIARCAGLGVVP